jgi:aerobic carbon-monoxide dehydrogenase small subunit
MNPTVRVSLEVNGTAKEIEVEPRTLLADAIRGSFGQHGTRIGCEHGVCGACTVLLDGEPVRSCLMFAVQADGHAVETVESLAEGNDQLNPLQSAMQRHHGLQCGFCTSGILMSLTALLRQDPHASEAHIREYLQGHLCRCTGYQQIVEAALDVSGRLDEAHGRTDDVSGRVEVVK